MNSPACRVQIKQKAKSKYNPRDIPYQRFSRKIESSEREQITE
jgi:hypothetical protein